MKRTQLFTKTSKTAPADEVAKNAQLLIRAGFIHKEMSGVYVYLPLGLRVLEKIKNIVREEMNAFGGQEIMMTALQPRELWEKTDRWDSDKVDIWFKTKLANGGELGLAPTHEEPIVAAVREYLNSYKDLPFSVYQIQTKFRNELRAKSGLLRGREFVMKDMYSFAHDHKEHEEIYERAAKSYEKVYERLGIGDITIRTKADGGVFTKQFSDEYQMLSDTGEDTIYIDQEKSLAINKEILTDENLEKVGLERKNLVEKRAIEVGNIFPLESKYTDALDVYYLDQNGERQQIIMGCYGIGVSRLMGAIAEVFADDRGLVWPESTAPFQVYLVQIGDDENVRSVAEKLYQDLQDRKIEVLWDDRDLARPGEKLMDADLMGIPHRVVISQKTLEQNKIEYKARVSSETEMLTTEGLFAKLDERFIAK